MAITFEIFHEPKRYSLTCGCMIPASYTAQIHVDGEWLPKWPCGDTREEAVQNVQREYPNAVEIGG